jgi:patatin-like phospholipase/acyl hydrolase
VVLAITKENVDALPTLFKTYDTSASLESCTIWQVARATSAATTFFKSIKVGRDEIEFIDAGFGYNNPCEILITEAQRQFPDRGQMRVLSIGTGLGDVVTIDNTRRSIINALKKMATSSRTVATRLDRRYGDDGQYYRLNVDQGLQDITLSDWDQASSISAHTRNYITENERAIMKFVENFTGMDQAGDGYNSPHAVSGRAIDQGETRPQEMSSTTVGELSGSPSG